MCSLLSVGLGGSIHDFATVVADETSILWGLEDERLTRIRHSIGHPDPLRPSFELARATFPEIDSGKSRIVANDVLRKVPLVSELNAEQINHHLAHAYSVYFTSSFERSIVLVIDGAGSITGTSNETHSIETTSVYQGEGNSIELLGRISGKKLCPSTVNAFEHPGSNSLGGLYELATTCCGFSPMQEGRTMALASFGDDRFVDDFNKRVNLSDGLEYQIDVHSSSGFRQFFRSLNDRYGLGDDMPFDLKASIARAAQETVEIIISHILRWAYKQTDCETLCVAGGVALNATAMGKLGQLSPFQRFSVVSCPGDSGTAVGAAIYGQLRSDKFSDTRRWKMSPYLGPRYAESYANPVGLRCTYEFSSVKAGACHVYELLEKGEIVACFLGRSEFGPRSLGNRSILAHPRVPGIVSKMNALKSREWFRPVSPATAVPARLGYEQGEMLMQYARPGASLNFAHRSCLHVDGSARVQTVTNDTHPFLWELLKVFEAHEENAVLNTSFNIQGEPIVETHSDAISTFSRSTIDALVIENKVYRRDQTDEVMQER